MLENIKIIKTFDLKDFNNRNDYVDLYNALLKLKKEFNYNEKIVFIHDEIEFYHKGSMIGFRIYNLLCLLNKIGISLSATCFVTTHNNLKESIEPFITHKNDRPLVIPILVSEMTYKNLSKFEHINPNKQNIKFKALSMMGVKRTHRILLCQFLQYSNLTSNIELSIDDRKNPMHGLTVLGDIKEFIDSEENDIRSIDNINIDELGLVFSTTPRLNENWHMFPKNHKLQAMVSTNFKKIQNSDYIEPTEGDFYNNFAIDVVTETSFDYPHAEVSEKLLRPLYLKTPFIVVGPSNILDFLHSHGFETFNDYWDEGYDKIKDPQNRFIACTKTIKYVLSLPLKDIKLIIAEMQPRLEKNRQILIDYIENSYKPLYNRINSKIYD